MLTVSDAEPGTPEPTWLSWPALRSAPPLALPAAAPLVVVVAPHPDDEVLGVGGLLSRACRAGTRVEVVSVTDGDGSHPSLAPDGRRRLAARRREETEAALGDLAVDGPVHRLGIADGAVAAEEAELAARLVPLLHPGTVCLATWRHDGHPDHEACGRAAAAACATSGATLVEYPIWAWHAPIGDARLPAGRLRRLELTDAEERAKAAAVRRFRSQTHPLAEAPDDGVVLPAAVLARFARPFETYLVGDDG